GEVVVTLYPDSSSKAVMSSSGTLKEPWVMIVTDGVVSSALSGAWSEMEQPVSPSAATASSGANFFMVASCVERRARGAWRVTTSSASINWNQVRGSAQALSAAYRAAPLSMVSNLPHQCGTDECAGRV